MQLYGIKNCDTVKKALKQLEAQGTVYDFIDVKTTPLSTEQLTDWLAQCPDELVNKRSTTYRMVKQAWLLAETNIERQIAIIQANPTLLKRPVLVKDTGEVMVGFDKVAYQHLSSK
ncbi:MAG: Spx/MgsR family RNA polymerase-binding regulatory protein [Ostreibacterium sp.]